ncbi:MAG: response regulator [Pseudomonadota bacterium]
MEPYKILIVDDIAKNIQVLGNLLRMEGYAVSYAVSGVQALSILEEELFDLILLDVMMPNMNGFQLCSMIKKETKWKEIPIIFLTAKAQLEDVIEGFQAGAVDYVTKPFNSKELLARVRTHLELKAVKKQLEKKNCILSQRNEELAKLNQELENALHEIKALRGILPICAKCKKIRRADSDPQKDDSWMILENYLMEYTSVKASHGLCPECMAELYPDFAGKKR